MCFNATLNRFNIILFLVVMWNYILAFHLYFTLDTSLWNFIEKAVYVLSTEKPQNSGKVGRKQKYHYKGIFKI